MQHCECYSLSVSFSVSEWHKLANRFRMRLGECYSELQRQSQLLSLRIHLGFIKRHYFTFLFYFHEWYILLYSLRHCNRERF